MRAWIYDKTVRPLTAGWYREVLSRLTDRAKLLDIGVGTGGALFENAELVRTKRLHVHGIDIDPDYVRQAQRGVLAARLEDNVSVEQISVYDHRGGPYDAAYFSASFMLMPDPPAALRHVVELLRPGAPVFFTQTFEHRRSKIVEAAKPLLHRVTTINFGKVTYEEDFLEAIRRAGQDVEEMTTLETQRTRSFRLAVTRAAAPPA